MSTEIKGQWRIPGFWVLVVSVISLLLNTIQLNISDIVIDDAFISFRYVQNLSQGEGLVYNPGERDEFTSKYSLFVVAKVRHGAPEDGCWVIRTSHFTQELFADGYITGIYCRPGGIIGG